MAVEWKDVTSYSRGDTVRKPTSFEAQLGVLRLSVTSNHVSARGVWTATCMPFFAVRELGVETREEAQEKALAMVRSYLEPINAALAEQPADAR